MIENFFISESTILTSVPIFSETLILFVVSPSSSFENFSMPVYQIFEQVMQKVQQISREPTIV